MGETWRLLVYALPIGIGATLLLDLWSWSLRRFGIRSMDWCLAGRWVGHWPRGRFMHASIGQAAPVLANLRNLAIAEPQYWDQFKQSLAKPVQPDFKPQATDVAMLWYGIDRTQDKSAAS